MREIPIGSSVHFCAISDRFGVVTGSVTVRDALYGYLVQFDDQPPESPILVQTHEVREME